MNAFRVASVVAVLACGPASAQWDLVQSLRPPPGGDEASTFGLGLAIDGGHVAVGQRGIDSDGWRLGRVYVYARSDGGWTSEQVIQRDDVESTSLFGRVIAMGGGVLLIAAPSHDEPRVDAGVVYCYRWDGDSWAFSQEIVPASGTRYEQNFGGAVSLDGSRVLIGGPLDRRRAAKQGAAFLFEDDGSSFSQVARLEASDGESEDHFGASAALSGDIAALGAIQETGPDGHVGSVYVFERVGTAWVETVKLISPDVSEYEAFGSSVALDGDTLIVGAPSWKPSHCTCNSCGCEWGRVHVYERVGPGDWELVQSVRPLDTHEWARFGATLHLEGDRLVVGAPRDERPQQYSGAAYVFERVGGTWTQSQRLWADDPYASDYFGTSVAAEGATVIVSATEDQFDEERNGAVYRYEGPSACVADWNGDGEVDTRDFLAFLTDWAAGDAGADLNEDGTVDTQDFLRFLNLWAAGC